jgi:NAD-dependent SIR2 family protein deacetylase
MGHTLDAESAHNLHVEPQHARCMECHEPLKEEHGKLYAHYDENCQMCHSAQDGMYQGTVEFVAEAMPSIKAELVDCSSCHMSTVENGVGSLGEIKQMCAECHEAGYDEMLDGWQEMIRDEITEAEGLLSDVSALLKKSEDKPQKQQASSLYEEAQKRVLFVQMDGSSGAHNVELADQLLTDAIDDLKRCQQLLK